MSMPSAKIQAQLSAHLARAARHHARVRHVERAVGPLQRIPAPDPLKLALMDAAFVRFRRLELCFPPRHAAPLHPKG